MTARLDLLRVFSDIFTTQTIGSALKIQFFVLWGLIMTKFYYFQYLMNPRSHKVDWPFKWPQERIYYGCSETFVLLKQPEVPQKCLFYFYLALSDEISEASTSPELHIILNWLTIQNDRTTHLSISVQHNIYIKDQRKWAKMRITGLLLNENFRIFVSV